MSTFNVGDVVKTKSGVFYCVLWTEPDRLGLAPVRGGSQRAVKPTNATKQTPEDLAKVTAPGFREAVESTVARVLRGEAQRLARIAQRERIEQAVKANAIGVTYDGSGWWLVKGLDGVNLGRLRQGVTQAWTAYTLDGARLQINGHDEYGGAQGPGFIARMVTWPNY